MDYLNAFLFSGILCLVFQILLVNTPLGFLNVLIVAICTGVVLAFFGVLNPLPPALGGPALLDSFGGGGLIVSITAAGEAIFYGMMGLLHGHPAPILGFIGMVSCVFITGIIVGIAKPTK